MLPLLLAVALATPAGSEAEVPVNVLVITVDALRPDRMALYGYDRPTTPYLDQIADELFLFDRAFATGAWTSPGIASIFTGLHPPAHGQGSRYDYIDERLYTPLDALRRSGRVAIARSVEDPTIRGLGFTKAYLPLLDDSSKVIEWLITQPEGWVMWMHLKPTHLPYDPSPFHERRFGGHKLDTPSIRAIRKHGTVYPEDYGLPWDPPVIASFTLEEQKVVRDLYDGTVADADAELGRIIERLRQSGHLGRTLLVISADHGEELFEHGWVGHASTGYRGKVYDELIRVPLLVRMPDGSLSGRTDALVSHIDVMPTVFEALSLDQAEVDGGMQGVSLLPLMRGDVQGVHDRVFARTTFKGWTCPFEESRDGATAVRTNFRKLIRLRRGDQITHEAYDLATDPAEQNDLFEKDRDRFADLVEALERYDRENTDHAAQLMFTVAERRIEELQRAARDQDAVAAARIWTAWVELERTYANEWVVAMEQPRFAGRWARLRRTAERLRERASQ
ncbi:MAG: hypothetical protein EA397_04930 [Deltaproteobacteria bacterium]|nr:MAG: hypothetical protein EA397_04930 [Deltaproteobacteria bacterium]